MKFYTIQEKIKNTNPEFKKYIKFSIFLLPSISLAIFLNVFFVEVLEINKSISYSLVSFIQILINFCLIEKYIFKTKKNNSKVISFLKYLSGIIIIRTLDWVIYINLLKFFFDFYIAIQILNTAILSMIKFKYLKYTMK